MTCGRDPRLIAPTGETAASDTVAHMEEAVPIDPARLIEPLNATVPDWESGPGGWRDEIEAALIDSVMGIRATYGSPTSGVRAVVARWREHEQPRPLDDLTRLADMNPAELALMVANRQRLAGGPLKTAGIVDAAARMLGVGVRKAAELNPDDPAHRDAYEGVAGLGPVTWQYLTLMLGSPGQDALWLADFASDAVARDVSVAEALDLTEAAADSVGADTTRVLRAIWAHQRR